MKRLHIELIRLNPALLGNSLPMLEALLEKTVREGVLLVHGGLIHTIARRPHSWVGGAISFGVSAHGDVFSLCPRFGVAVCREPRDALACGSYLFQGICAWWCCR